MPRHEQQATLAYFTHGLFTAVAGVKDHPRFAPWCSGVHIHHEDQRDIIAGPVIGFGPLEESFTVTLNRPRQVLARAIEGSPGTAYKGVVVRATW